MNFSCIRLLRFTTTVAAAMVVALSVLCLGGCAAQVDRHADRDAPLSTSAERDQFRELLLKALDREALYTLVGGLKPLSTGFWRGELDVAQPNTVELARVRRLLAPLRDDTYYADVQAFATTHDGKRHLEAYVVHLASFAAMIEREREFWSPLGVTPCTHPAEVVAIVDRLPRADRWRAYGMLFGYPKYAIDFFVEAGERARANGSEVGPGKDREFLHVPTASATEGQFTWAVPLGHMEREEDRAIRTRAEAILAAYRRAAPQLAAEHDPVPMLRRLNAMLVSADDRAVARVHGGGVWQSTAHGRLAGVWSVEHVEVFAKDGAATLPEKQSHSLRDSWSRTDQTNSLLREQKLTILHTLNADGTYTHTLDWADAPERRFEESGTWTIDSAGVLRCVTSNGQASSLPEARLLHIDDATLIVRMDFTGAASGQSEIIRHRRIPAASSSPKPGAPSSHGKTDP